MAAVSSPTAGPRSASRTRRAPARRWPAGCRPLVRGPLGGRGCAAASAGCRAGRRCSAGPSGSSTRRGSGASDRGGTTPRAPASSTIGSSSARRTTNASASSEAESTHCASSTTRRRGASAATADSSESRATPTRRGVGSSSSDSSPRAVWRAERWDSGSWSLRSRTPCTSWCSPAKASSVSLRPPRERSTVQPPCRAVSAAALSSLLLPSPASPTMTRLSPVTRSGPTSRWSSSSSTSRPTRGRACSTLSLLTALRTPLVRGSRTSPGGTGPGSAPLVSSLQICASGEDVSQL